MGKIGIEKVKAIENGIERDKSAYSLEQEIKICLANSSLSLLLSETGGLAHRFNQNKKSLKNKYKSE